MRYKLVYVKLNNPKETLVKEMTFQQMKDKVITYACMDNKSEKPDLRSVRSVAKALEPNYAFVRAIKIFD